MAEGSDPAQFRLFNHKTTREDQSGSSKVPVGESEDEEAAAAMTVRPCRLTRPEKSGGVSFCTLMFVSVKYAKEDQEEISAGKLAPKS